MLGTGPIGLGAIYWLASRGVQDIVAVDQSAERLECARALGARHIVNTRETNLRTALIDCHGTGETFGGSPTVSTDIYFDMTGAPSLLNQILEFGKSRSRIVLTAIYKGPVSIDLRSLLLREINIIFSVVYQNELVVVLDDLSKKY